MRLVSLAVLLAASLFSQELTLDQILERNLAAIGGETAVREIQTLKMTATMVVAGTAEVPMTTMIRRPNLIRTEVVYQGQPVITAFDGTVAWMIPPGSKDPQKMDEKSAASLSSADLDSSVGDLSALKDAGHRFELVSKEDVAGKPAHKIRVTRKGGATTVYFLDAETFLPVKIVSTVPQMGQNMEVESFPTGYAKEGAIVIAHSIENKVQGRSMMQVTVKKVEINTPLEDGLFQMPAAEKPADKSNEKEVERNSNKH